MQNECKEKDSKVADKKDAVKPNHSGNFVLHDWTLISLVISCLLEYLLTFGDDNDKSFSFNWKREWSGQLCNALLNYTSWSQENDLVCWSLLSGYMDFHVNYNSVELLLFWTVFYQLYVDKGLLGFRKFWCFRWERMSCLLLLV